VPLSLRRGRVTSVTERHEGLVRLEVDERQCVAYPRLTGPVALGDEVVVNVQAVELALGSGGFDVLYANLTRGLDLPPETGAHVVALPYTPLQIALGHGEEGDRLAETLAAMPVVCCSLHSQLAPVCAGVGAGVRTVYVQLGGGALPVSLSDTVRALKARGLFTTAVAVAPCLEGDVQCVTVYSALAWAAGRFDVAVCGIGPGIVGTETALGHGGLAAAQAANAASALGGRPVIAVRRSDVDVRERHRGLSHHTEAVIRACLGEVQVAWPEDVDVAGWEPACAGLPLSHMGRGPDDDPSFFRAAYAAGRLARALL
jgi:Protein of unknown function (DUF3866)